MSALRSLSSIVNSLDRQSTTKPNFWCHGRDSIRHNKFWDGRKKLLDKASLIVDKVICEKNNEEVQQDIAYVFAQYSMYFAEYCRCTLTSKPSEKHKYYQVSGTKGVFFVCGCSIIS